MKVGEQWVLNDPRTCETIGLQTPLGDSHGHLGATAQARPWRGATPHLPKTEINKQNPPNIINENSTPVRLCTFIPIFMKTGIA